jgi:hypothetical protein
MDVVQGQLITAGSTNATALSFTDLDNTGAKTFFIKVVSGTVEFGIGGVHADAHGWTTDDVVPPFHCFDNNLYFKAASSNDTFVVTATP